MQLFELQRLKPSTGVSRTWEVSLASTLTHGLPTFSTMFFQGNRKIICNNLRDSRPQILSRRERESLTRLSIPLYTLKRKCIVSVSSQLFRPARLIRHGSARLGVPMYCFLFARIRISHEPVDWFQDELGLLFHFSPVRIVMRCEPQNYAILAQRIAAAGPHRRSRNTAAVAADARHVLPVEWHFLRAPHQHFLRTCPKSKIPYLLRARDTGTVYTIIPRNSIISRLQEPNSVAREFGFLYTLIFKG